MGVIFSLLAAVYLWWGMASCELVQGQYDRFPKARAHGLDRVVFLPLLWPPAGAAFSWWLGFWQTPTLEMERAG